METNNKRFGIGHVLALVVFFGFSILLLGGYWIYESKAPIPGVVQTAEGETLFTSEQILGGQAVLSEVRTHGLGVGARARHLLRSRLHG